MTVPSDLAQAAQSPRPIRKSPPGRTDLPNASPEPTAPVAPIRRDRRSGIIHDIAPADRCFGPEAELMTGLPSTVLMRLAERGAFAKQRRIAPCSFCRDRRELLAWLAAHGRPTPPPWARFVAK